MRTIRVLLKALVTAVVPPVAAVLVLAGFPGCNAAVVDAVVTPASLIVVQGNLQSGAVGTLLPTPVVMRVRGSDGLPLAKVPISFSVTSGGGAVDPGTVVSDVNGEVKAKWSLGPLQVQQSLSAVAPGLDPVPVLATGIMPSDLVVAQGNNQTAKAGSALPVQLVIRVTGSTNIPIPGVTVAFSITGGTGSITPQSIVTNALGEATARWTLGTQAGSQQASVTAFSLGPIFLTATATP
ncbi:MAG: Ig-like domain-containing protein [Gemmatimonadota bacterium]|nr:Ig-like domain-containing protein [Gemmatimonadota bacterium]